MYLNESNEKIGAGVKHNWLLGVEDLGKTFTLHNQGGIKIDALDDFHLELKKGECIVLSGPSGAGKSSILKLIYGNYKLTSGKVRVMHKGEIKDLSRAEPLEIIDIRKHTIGYVSQFLDVIPRISAVEAVAEPLLNLGVLRSQAEEKAADILKKLNLPEKLFDLPPATFSGGEKQRVNIAKGFIHDYPIMILDEPTASLDKENVEIVCSLVDEKLKKGTGIIGIFHDEELKKRLASKMVVLDGKR